MNGFKWALAAFTLLGAAAAWSSQPRQPVTLRVADLLDELIQPRFQKEAGEFGVTRIIRPSGHGRLAALREVNPQEQKRLDQIHAFERDYLVCLLRVRHPPGSFRGGFGNAGRREASSNGVDLARPSGLSLMPLTSRAANETPTNVYTANMSESLYKSFETATREALPKMIREGTASTAAGPWMVTLRPVRAAHQSCLSCHRGTKEGDTLGVLVYAVNQNILTVSNPAPKRRPLPTVPASRR